MTLAEPTLAALRALGGDVRTRAVDLAALAHDASHYLLRPQAVVTARDTTHVADLLRVAAGHALSVAFRSAGTSLSGQAGTDGLLVDTRRHFRRIEVLADGARVRAQPGATVRAVNAHLAPHGTRIGPDPASEAACTIGGVVANNSSGMACGTQFNAYRTVAAMTFVLPSGTTVDTAAGDADEQLRAGEPALYAGLAALRERVRADPTSVARIRQQFAMKNTMGYALNAFLDFDRPVDILSHLLIGSEGTLGFVGEVTFQTVPVRPYAATALLVFDSIDRATDALPALLAAGAHTIELLDAASLRVVQHDRHAGPELAGLAVANHTALLVELQAMTAAELDHELSLALPTLDALPLATAATFTTDPRARAALWQLRKGLYTAVAGARPVGTTALLEDIVVPLDVLTAVTRRLTGLFATHGYDGAVIFGHAKDGNLHFMINPRFDDPDEVRRYDAFTEDLVDLVLGAGGSLKAEHGTGRIMAPYVRRQFGDELYAVMREVKRLCDPAGVLNPGVVLSDDPRIHLAHLKTTPPVDPLLDTCVECGYCEPVCPSRDVTTTPRQRIVLLREIAQAETEGDTARAQELRHDFGYEAVDTCAADSMCLVACPVAIDTGAAMKGLRARRLGPAAQRGGAAVARHWAGAVSGLRGALRTAGALPDGLLSVGTRTARRVLPTEWTPHLDGDLPGPGPRRSAPARPADAVAVFFPACVDSIFGPADGDGVSAAFSALCERAGVPVAVPAGIAGLCCGTPWRSKGLTRGYEEMASRTLTALWDASAGGRRPVVCAAASCAHGLHEIGDALDGDDLTRFRALTVLDAVSFVRAQVLPQLTVRRRLGAVVVHPTCASEHLDSTADLRAVAAACAEQVVVPKTWGCCGFAGDRGLLHPELAAGATAAQAAEIAERRYDAYVSNNRTCELGMSRATGRTYRHVLELLEDVTR
ncbi:FAD-linked oxidase C-terminal domain-containing protein [Micromonospora sp. FIMYZ51]|uniref:FAD-linked oxidase C-terminal domain-containing protein n=1 Tax=Micromonospora sp. FIMYZ51 TaxID=3051832 RepID=UPI00311DC0A8